MEVNISISPEFAIELKVESDTLPTEFTKGREYINSEFSVEVTVKTPIIGAVGNTI